MIRRYKFGNLRDLCGYLDQTQIRPRAESVEVSGINKIKSHPDLKLLSSSLEDLKKEGGCDHNSLSSGAETVGSVTVSVCRDTSREPAFFQKKVQQK